MNQNGTERYVDEILSMGRDRGFLSADELADALEDVELGADDLDRLYALAVRAGVRVGGPELGEFAEAIEELLNDPTSDPVRGYLRRVAAIDPLPDEEVNGLGRETRRRVMEGNQWLVVTIAKRYLGRGLLLGDLIASANRGLLYALNRFDREMGVPFPAFATWWVRKAIARAIAENSKVVRIPTDTIADVFDAEEQLRNELGREPTSTEVAQLVGLEGELVASILRSPNLKAKPVPPSAN
jgi:RNA polymerase primary sigma factor